MSTRHCIYDGCNAVSRPEKSIQMFRFPKNPTEEWLAVVNKPIDWRPSRSSWLCSSHFLVKDMFGNKLLPGAVPLLQQNNLNNSEDEHDLEEGDLLEGDIDEGDIVGGDMLEVDLDDGVECEVVSGGEGGVLIHGKLLLTTDDRAVLFSPDLDSMVKCVVCSLCGHVTSSLTAWRVHCLNRHKSAPGYSPSLLHSEEILTPQHFTKTEQNNFSCSSCERVFPSEEDMEDHRNNSMRTVRLVCPKCSGQYSDLEEHIQEEHEGETYDCVVCGLDTNNILAHHHSLHEGFSSVLAESCSSCFGDGITSEWFETVLETSARFLASEVKPEVSTDPASPPPVSITPTAPAATPSPGVGTRKGSEEKATEGRQMLKVRDNLVAPHSLFSSSSPPGINQTKGSEMSVSERHEYNISMYNKFRTNGFNQTRNECEICGFVPYTKNKYREKQDHLAKYHFKERIDALIPTQRPYTCPEKVCPYIGRDKQDILRHYTGKHNMLRMWVDEFIISQTGQDCVSPAPCKSKPPDFKKLTHESVIIRGKESEALTFAEMEKRAILEQQTEVPGVKGTLSSLSSTPSPNGVRTNGQQLNKLLKPPLTLSPKTVEAIAQTLSTSSPHQHTLTIATPSGQISLTKQSSAKLNTVGRRYSTEPASSSSAAAAPLSSAVVAGKLAGSSPAAGNLILVRCSHCPGNRVFPSFAALDLHCRTEHPEQQQDLPQDLPTESRQNILTCPLCPGLFFTTQLTLQLHTARAHLTGGKGVIPTGTGAQEPEEAVDEDEVGVDPLADDDTSSSTTSSSSCQPGARKPFSCPECNMCFPSDTALQLHLSVCRDPAMPMLTAKKLISAASRSVSMYEPPKKKPRRPPPSLMKLGGK